MNSLTANTNLLVISGAAIQFQFAKRKTPDSGAVGGLVVGAAEPRGELRCSVDVACNRHLQNYRPLIDHGSVVVLPEPHAAQHGQPPAALDAQHAQPHALPDAVQPCQLQSARPLGARLLPQ